MQRKALSAVAAGLAFAGASGAFGQHGDLGGVTMRVLDDLGDVDAVVITLGGGRPEADARSGAGGERSEGEVEDHDVEREPVEP